MQCSTVNLFTQLLSSRNWRKFTEFPQDTWACIKALHFTNGISNYFCTLLLKCFCHISSLINSQMHNKKKTVKNNSPKQCHVGRGIPRESLPN